MIGMLCISSKLDEAMELIDVMPQNLKGKRVFEVLVWGANLLEPFGSFGYMVALSVDAW